MLGSLVLALMLVAGAASGLWNMVYFSEITQFADRLDKGSTLNSAAVTRLTTMPKLAAAEGRCTTARAVVALRLAGLNATPRSRDVFQDDALIDSAAATIDQALRCFPLDGSLWLSSAVVSMAAAGPTDDVVSTLEISSWTAPSEVRVLRQRLHFVATLYDGGVEAIRNVLMSDIRHGVRNLHLEVLERLYAVAGSNTRMLYREALLFVAMERRERIVARFNAIDQYSRSSSFELRYSEIR